MEVISHQAAGMHLKTRSLAGFDRRLKRMLPNHIVLENTFPRVA